MYRYIVKRLLQLIPVILGASLLVFLIMNMAKGDAATIITATTELTQEEIDAVRASMGLDKPVLVRYIGYLGNMLRGDFGNSAISGESVMQMFFKRFPYTVALATIASLINLGLSIPIGIYSANHQGTIADNASMVFALAGLSIPGFWLGLMLMLLFSVKLGWLPATGWQGPASAILPSLTLGIGMMATSTRTTRSAMLDVLRQDYLRTARSKGVPEKYVINKHALKNAMIPILTIFGTQLARALGGSAVIEAVFAYPGVGKLILDGVNNRDTTLVCGCIILSVSVTMIVLLIVDILYAYVDPRIKAQYQKGGKKRAGKA